MRKVPLMMLCALVAASPALSRAEARRADTYQTIISRNPFGLKDPPPAPEPAKQPEKPQEKKSEFYLTGISTFGFPKKPKRAYLMNKDNNKKDYNDKYFNLTVGDKVGDIALQDIDEKGRRVKIAYRGEEMWLSMKDNGVPTPAGPAPGMPVPGMQPGVPMAPQPLNSPMPVPLPMATPAQQPNSTAPNANTRRFPRTAMNGAMNGGMSGSPYAMPNTSVSSFPMPGGNTMPAAAPVNQGPQTDAEMLQHIIQLQNQSKLGTLPADVPPPPVPTLPGAP